MATRRLTSQEAQEVHIYEHPGNRNRRYSIISHRPLRYSGQAERWARHEERAYPVGM